jgi:hypothetical protein
MPIELCAWFRRTLGRCRKTLQTKDWGLDAALLYYLEIPICCKYILSSHSNAHAAIGDRVRGP